MIETVLCDRRHAQEKADLLGAERQARLAVLARRQAEVSPLLMAGGEPVPRVLVVGCDCGRFAIPKDRCIEVTLGAKRIRLAQQAGNFGFAIRRGIAGHFVALVMHQQELLQH